MTSTALDHTFLERALREAVLGARFATPLYAELLWEARLEGDTLELLVGRRGSRVPTLDTRQILIRCGAALLNARTVLARHSLVSTISRFPDGPDAPTFARIEVRACSDPEEPVPDERLAALTPWLRPARGAGHAAHDLELPRALITKFATVAAQEDAFLVRVARADHLEGLAILHRRAEDMLGPHAEPWPMPQGPSDRGAQTCAALPRQRTSSAIGTLLLLGTRRDGPPAWLRSGEALQRVSLELTRIGAAARPLTTLPAVPVVWATLRRGLSLDFYPQVLFRVVRADADARPES